MRQRSGDKWRMGEKKEGRGKVETDRESVVNEGVYK